MISDIFELVDGLSLLHVSYLLNQWMDYPPTCANIIGFLFYVFPLISMVGG